MTLNVAMKMLLPWADEITKGKFPILIRKMNTKYRSRVSVFCSQSFDRWVLTASCNPDIYEELFGHIIGSVQIYDVKEVRKKDILSILRKEGGKKFVKWYPKHFIPDSNIVYFWYLKNARRYKKPYKVNRNRGIVWIKLTSQELKDLEKWI